ncbi:MAG: translesion error-prone DNA polymerase V autoproteolytic subunit [Bacteroidetes bacterium]|nr:translesion error-prone DNA polymerase V autoproteolytic subunit [Bacteroidota bacterium]
MGETLKLNLLKSTSSITFYSADTASSLSLPFAIGGIAAGFPSPAEDYLELSLDLNRELVKDQSATFYGRVKGNSMIEAGFADGDVIIIDRSAEPVNGKIAVCYINGEFTVKRLKKIKDDLYLMPANSEFKPIKITEETDFVVWGIVTYIIKKV